MKTYWYAAALLSSIAACSPRRDAQAPVNNAEDPVLPAPSAPPAVRNDAAPASTEQSAPSVDPKSVEAAAQVAQSYGAYLESGELAKAAQLWTDPNAASAFAQQLKGTAHIEVGKPGPAEGAAGSSYTTVPATFTEKDARRPADIILRRVNDVPGSTEAQRRWRIERIEWKDAG